MANQVLLSVSNNEGYAPDQITGSMTLASLLQEVQQAIEMHGPDAMIVTMESGNHFGARYGSLSTWEDTFTAVDAEAECADCGGAVTEGSEYCRDCEEMRHTS